MDKEQRKELLEQSKRELKKQREEDESDLNSGLMFEEAKDEKAGRWMQFQNKYVELAVIFLGTLLTLYIVMFVAYNITSVFLGPVFRAFGISIPGITIGIHIIAWTASLYSAFQRRSVLQDIYALFF